jgi:hypothetical protein
MIDVVSHRGEVRVTKSRCPETTCTDTHRYSSGAQDSIIDVQACPCVNIKFELEYVLECFHFSVQSFVVIWCQAQFPTKARYSMRASGCIVRLNLGRHMYL